MSFFQLYLSRQQTTFPHIYMKIMNSYEMRPPALALVKLIWLQCLRVHKSCVCDSALTHA